MLAEAGPAVDDLCQVLGWTIGLQTKPKVKGVQKGQQQHEQCAFRIDQTDM